MKLLVNVDWKKMIDTVYLINKYSLTTDALLHTRFYQVT